jgi:hypothetical protein
VLPDEQFGEGTGTRKKQRLYAAGRTRTCSGVWRAADCVVLYANPPTF